MIRAGYVCWKGSFMHCGRFECNLHHTYLKGTKLEAIGYEYHVSRKKQLYRLLQLLLKYMTTTYSKIHVENSSHSQKPPQH